jgi:hypothetical protein
MTKALCLSLDEVWQDGYFYTEFDIGGMGHYIYIRPEDKEKFLDAFAKEWRDRAKTALTEEEVDWIK